MVSLAEAKLELTALQERMSDVTLSYLEVRQVEMSLIRIGNLVSRMSGSPDVDNFIRKVNTAIMTVRALQIAMHALEVASGPIGWLYAATTIIGFGVMAGETALELTS
ncbi:hypothetical protein MUO83_07830 [Candidatus Bathyarchaeota archaeon]|nr:hypothetical protein [Candidatus Bathyarchaeota archaeon]